MKNNLATIIMAGGKGTRMNSSLPKVLHKLNDKTLIEHVIEKAKKIDSNKIVIIVGYKHNQVIDHLKDMNLEFVLQEKQLGTGHAIMQCEALMQSFNGHTLILSGDVPLITKQTLINLYNYHIKNNSDATVMSAKINDPYGYGRIIRNGNLFESIVEEKDANTNQKKINEINSGIYIFNNKILFNHIKKIKNNNTQKEFYLPDVLPVLIDNNYKILVYNSNNNDEIRGINTIEHLNELEKKI